MMRLLALLACLCLVLAACDSGSTERASDLSFAEVAQRAVDALSRPGQVFHAVETVGRQGQGRTDEVWLDLENDIARVDEGGHLRVFHEGKIAELSPEGRFQDAENGGADLDKTSALALDYISALAWGPVQEGNVYVLKEEGRDVYRVEVKKEWHGDWNGTRKFEIYLDEQFFPIRMKDRVEGAGPENREIDTEVKWDFIPRSDLPAGFLSVDAVKAMEITPLDDLKRATDEGRKLYWLGETFEGMALKDFHHWSDLPPRLTYGQGKPWTDPDWVMIDEYTPEEWAERGHDRCQEVKSRPAETELIVLGMEASLCELPWPGPPPPQPEEGVPEEPSPIAPEDDCFDRQLIIHFPDAVVVVNTSSGPCGTDPYRSREGVLRLGASLRPFEMAIP